MIIDLYAGAGGWDQAATRLGLPTVGLELEHDPCVTAVRAGHPRIRCDVATYPTQVFAGRVAGLIASPPCQAWSMAGKRTGEQDKARVHHLVNAYAAGADQPGDGWADPRSHHAAQPVRWIRDLRPEWVALEQVPPVIDLWAHIGDVLRGWGYSVWTGTLNAADYGVPQTRRRAILIASRVRTVHQPETTHEQNPPKHALFGARQPWVSMAQALGWDGMALVNGDQTRATIRDDDEPAATIYGQRLAKLQWVLRAGNQPNAAVRRVTEPAPTMAFGNNAARVEWVEHRAAGAPQAEQDSQRVTVEQAAALQSFPADYPWHGTKTSQFLQVGNAVPPGLASAVLAVAAGRAHALTPARTAA